jgi:type II secretory pathway pseudopilin PulG
MERNMTARFFRTKSEAGFTLLELVVVLGITGMIFGGLWGLISSGGAQLQAQSAAQQYRQVIEATRRLLVPGVDQGNFHPTSFNANPDGVTPGTPGDLPIAWLTDPAVALLSPNFAQNVGGRYFDAFGHEIKVSIQHMDNGNTKWRYMVYSTPANGAPNIGDKTGAQVSSLIGSEGGFVYASPTEGCTNTGNVAQISCGSYNAFAFTLSTLNVPNGSGRIATLSFTSDNSTIGAPWLMRIPAPALTDFNTMSAPLDFRNNTLSLNMRGSPFFSGDGSISLGTTLSSTASPGKLTINGGQIWMGADGATTGGGTLNMAASTLNMQQGPITNAPSVRNTGSIVLGSTSGNINMNTGLGVSVTTPTIGTDPITGQPTISLGIQGTGRADTFQAGQFIYTSDFRYKEHLRPIPNALEKVTSLRGYNYDWKGNHAPDVGLVAQDVQKVFPELVTKVNNDHYGVDYAKMIAPMVEAIRELKERNDKLQLEVDALKKDHIAH